MIRVNKKIQKDLEKIVKILSNKLRENLCALLLYGSWVKGRAREYSDIDLLVVLKTKRKNQANRLDKLIENVNLKRDISIICASSNEFKKEAVPIYTAAKKEGQIIYGNLDLSLNLTPPEIKYKDFFKRSKHCEKEKIKMAEYLIKKDISSSICEFCYIAAKHAIQAGLAMRGVGFHSKFCLLINWTKEYFGKDIEKAFKFLFTLYIKAEYMIQDLTKRECHLAIKEAKKILNRIYK